MAFKRYHLNSAASPLSLRLGGYTRTSGWPAEPPIMNRASLTAICLGEQLCLAGVLVLNISSMTMMFHISKMLRALSPLFFTFTPSNSSILSHRGLVCTVNTLTIILLCLLLCETPSASPTALLLACACWAKPDGSKNKKPKQGRHHHQASL